MRRPLAIDRFEEMTVPEPNTGCLLWLGGVNAAGYGRTWNGTRNVLVHRVSYERAYGRIPEGLSVCHRCDTPLCVNPDHLFLGTHADNVADRDRKGRGSNPIARKHAAKTHCPKGHEYSGENLYITTDSSGRTHRQCRTCKRATFLRFTAKRRQLKSTSNV